MKVLGVVLAGGQSSRFGSDKAEAMLGGRTLLDRAAEAIAPRCDRIAVVGRSHPAAVALSDWPGPGMGPLGGLAGGLLYAREQGFDAMLSIPVDCGSLPDDLVTALDPAPSYVASQPVIGLWPASALESLQAILSGDGKHSVLRFCETIGARAVSGFAPGNINTRGDLAQAETALRRTLG